MSRWATLSWPDRLIAVGAAGLAVGALAVLAARGRNLNDVPGASSVLLVLALLVAGAWVIGLRAGERSSPAAMVAAAAALAAVTLAALETVEVVRAGFATDRLGLMGLAGRLICLVAAVLLVIGTRARGPRLRVRGQPPAALLMAAGAVGVVVGWALLIGLASGFAIRVLDAAGIAAAVGAGSVAVSATGRGARLAVVGLGLVVLLAGLDVVLVLAPRFGSLLDSDPAGPASLAVYLAGAVAVVAGAALTARTMLSRASAAATS